MAPPAAASTLDRPHGLDLDLEHLPFDTDTGIGARAALGLLVLETDQTIEHEFRRLLPREGVALYGARLHNDAEITPEKLREMERAIAPTTALLPPMVALASIGFACTSGALVIGEGNVARHVASIRPASAVTDPVTAARAALAALGVKRVALLTPYVRRINHVLRESLVARGLEIPVMGSFNEADDAIVARITARAIRAAVIELGRSPACDGVFVSCTSLRVAEIVADAERELGKPVTSSNHALAWHMLRLAGIRDAAPEHGRLYTVDLASA